MTYVAQGDWASDLTTALSTASTGLAAGKAILTDPYLIETVNLVVELHKLEQGPKKPGSTTSSSSQPGIGLKRVVGPLRTYVALRRQGPWVLPALALGVAGAIFATGYAMGRSR
jgi:hypothetical protein